MAVFQFSALSDGQSISFDPSADVLNSYLSGSNLSQQIRIGKS
jgi:hypothetical protein